MAVSLVKVRSRQIPSGLSSSCVQDWLCYAEKKPPVDLSVFSLRSEFPAMDFSEFKNLAYLPLDMEVPTPDFARLQRWMRKFDEHPRTNPSDNLSSIPFVIGPLMATCSDEEWFDQKIYDRCFADRHTKCGQARFMFGFENEFPELAQLIRELPIEIGFVELLSNRTDIQLHFDGVEIDGKPDFTYGPFMNIDRSHEIDADVEPCSYKIYLQDDKLKTLYFCESFVSKEMHFARFPSPCCAVVYSKCTFPHGAMKVDNHDKFVISIHGKVKRQDHYELLKRSYEKYKSFSISLGPTSF